jgi:hypothetical protein
MMVSGCTGCGAGNSSNNGSNHRSLAVTGCGSYQSSRGGATTDDGGGPAVMRTIDIYGRGLDIYGRRRISVAVAAIIYIAAIAILIPPVIVSEVAILVISAVTMIGGLMLRYGTIAVAVLRRENWNTRAKQRHYNVDCSEFLNVFHNCLRH